MKGILFHLLGKWKKKEEVNISATKKDSIPYAWINNIHAMRRSHKNPSLHVFFSRFEDYLKVNSPSSQRAVTHPPSALCVLYKDFQLWLRLCGSEPCGPADATSCQGVKLTDTPVSPAVCHSLSSSQSCESERALNFCLSNTVTELKEQSEHNDKADSCICGPLITVVLWQWCGCFPRN